MYRRAIACEQYNNNVLFDVADGATLDNWYRVNGARANVTLNANNNIYRIRFKASGGFAGDDVSTETLPYFYYEMLVDDTIPSNWNTFVEIVSNPANYTIKQVVCTKNSSDSMYYADLALEAGKSYILPTGNFLPANYKRNYTFTFSGENCTGTGKFRVVPDGALTDFVDSDKIPLAWELVITLTANTGFQFIGSNIITNSNAYFGTPTITNNGTTLTAVYPVLWNNSIVPATSIDQYPTSGTIGITAQAVMAQDGNTISVTKAENCTFSGVPSDGFIPTGDSVTLTATAKDGFYFAGTPLARYTNTEGKVTVARFSRSTDNLTATLTQIFSEIAQNNTNIGLEATAVEIPPKVWNVTVGTESNCTVESPATYTEDTALVITATANDGYKFKTAPKISDGTNSFNFTLESETVAKFNQDISAQLAEGVTLTITASADKIPVMNIVVQAEYSTVTGVPASMQVRDGDTLTLTATANENYQFSLGDEPYIAYTGTGGQIVKRKFTIDAEDAQIARFSGTVSNFDDGKTLSIVSVAVPSTVYKDKYGTINVYNVTVENLEAFAKKRFFTVSSENPTEIDLGNYVPKIFRLYCDVGNTFDTTLHVGNYDLSEIKVKTPINDVLTVDCGTTQVAGVNGNANDYNGTVQVFLPFVGMQSLDIDKVLNKPLHLYYKVNIVTGESVAFLDVENVPFYFFDCNISQEILYLSHTQDRIGDYDFKSKFLYGLRAYIIYKYNPDITDGTLVSGDNIRKKVKNCMGYFEMYETTPFNSDTMNEYERAKIIELLNSGVFYGKEFE